MAESMLLGIGYKKGLVSFRGGLQGPTRVSRCAALSAGRFGVLVLIDQRRGAQDLRIELHAFFRNEDSALHRHGQDVPETAAPAFSAGHGRTLVNIWSLEAGDAKSKKNCGCGVEPASLFAAVTAAIRGKWWPGITPRPRPQWQPGNGGLCMHTIVRDGSRVHTRHIDRRPLPEQDGGQTFRASNSASARAFVPDPIRNSARRSQDRRHRDAPGRPVMQNHGGWEDRPGIGVPAE